MRQFILFIAASMMIAISACKDEGVKTEHGFRLINHTKLEGAKVLPGETVVVHVNTWLGDSLVGSTYKTGEPRKIQLPTREQLGERVPSIFDAAMLMTKGDSATLLEEIDTSKVKFLPEKLKNERIIRYEIKMVDVITKDAMEKAQKEAMDRFVSIQAKMNQVLEDYNGGKLNSKLTTTSTGLKVMIEDKGNGGPLKVGEMVKTHYYGITKGGKMFDNSFQRGEAMEWPLGVGRMIPGFDEGTQLLNKGGKAVFFIPPTLGYGAEGTPDGSIPPNSEIIFYVEVQ